MNQHKHTGTRQFALFGIAILLVITRPVLAQNAPHIGYVYPAGGQQGASIKIVVGGQQLGNVTNAFVTGEGVEAKVIEYNRPLNPKEFTELRDKLKDFQNKRQANRKSLDTTNTWTTAEEKEAADIRAKILKNPPNRQGNPAIAETVTVQVTLATNATPGEHEIRLATPNGLSNPLLFCVGRLPEFSRPAAKIIGTDIEKFLERFGKKPVPAKSESRITVPAIVNGQILPGKVDRYRFPAQSGQRLVVAVSARRLIPYLPDAVPGWFQATLMLCDSKGRELAYAADFHFSPDPVLVYEITRTGDYMIQIKDSIYRGREDFVYRIAIGELPFVTGIFPLGGPAGMSTTVEFRGWNFSATNVTQEVKFSKPGLYGLSTTNDERVSNLMPFAVDTLPECPEQEPNNLLENAQRVILPIIVNGRIDRPSDVDVFRFEGRAGTEVVAEVNARRLNSPLDSMLRLTDTTGKQIAFNDDYEDKGMGLETHHADSYLRTTLPTNGTFYLYLNDTQGNGGPEYGYRLRLSPPQPDFSLRVVPSSLSVRGGVSVPLTVYALRKDGFTNEITVKLKDAPEGFILNGAQVPANQDKVRFTLAASPTGQATPVIISLEGWALIGGRTVSRPAVPAEDMMQAFAYRHLVPAKELAVFVAGRTLPKLKILDPTPIKIPAGGTARVHFGPVGPKFADNFQLELSEPPEGISLKSTATSVGSGEIELAADAAKTKPGQRGNLIVNLLAVKKTDSEKQKKPGNARRLVTGALPAIPFETTARE